MATIVASSTFAVRETASLGQQMLKEPLGINGLNKRILNNVTREYYINNGDTRNIIYT